MSISDAGGIMAKNPENSGTATTNDRPTGLTLGNFQDGPNNRWAFNHLREVLPTANIPHDSRRVLPLERSPHALGDFSIDFQGKNRTLVDIAEEQYTDGLLILRDGKIVVEKYFGQLAPDRPHLMMSVTKSVVALLAGKLAARGVIDLSKPVAEYVPELSSSGWGPDSLQTLLDMKDGADYTEDYEDASSTVRLQDCAVGWADRSLFSEDVPRGGFTFLPGIGRNENNLGKFVYKSGSTDVVGWVLEAATGKTLPDLIAKHIWQPMGAEHDAYITVDESGFTLANGGMNATLRDLARVGQLMLADGHLYDEQIIPAAFIDDIYTQRGDPDWPGERAREGWAPYYRSFWWGWGNGEGNVSGLGIHGQVLHVAPEAGVVVAMYSSWPRADGDVEHHGWKSVDALLIALLDRFC